MYNTYNKLVRDSIPNIISESGAAPDIDKLNDLEFSQEIVKALHKRIDELLDGYNLETLADVVELLDAFCEAHGIAIDEVMHVKEKMRASRGGYDKRIFLKGYID